jgi:hypothetical protein
MEPSEMRNNQTRNLILKALQEQSGFSPVVSGSRFFGTDGVSSDWDYLCKDSEISRKFLENNEFVKLVSPLNEQYNLQCVYRNATLNMDCLMLKRPHIRLSSMLLLRKFSLGSELKNKIFARKLFQVVTRLEEQIK